MAETDTVRRNDAESRYELLRDGEVLGYCEFVEEDGRIVLPHTVVDPAYGGQGLGGLLVKGALEDLAARDETVVPACPFVARWLEKHEVPGLDVVQPDAA